MAAYYNEIDTYAAQWLRNLIAAGHIAPGDVDERSIVDVQPDDLKGYTQAHFFAGIGGWSLAARLSGWPDDRPLWTGSCPCQPFSVAGKGKGAGDERHLWPIFFALIAARRPPVVMGEQVAAAVGKDWLDGVSSDLEGIGYACGAAVVPACAVDAPHRRDRLWFVADANIACEGEGRKQRGGQLGRARCDQEAFAFNVAHASGARRRQIGLPASGYLETNGRWSRDRHGDAGPADARSDVFHANGKRRKEQCRAEPIRAQQSSAERASRNSTAWSGAVWAIGADGKARRVEPGIRLLAHGVPARVGKLRAYGNAIVPQVAAEVIGAYMEAA